jgi:hypothetical protein
LLRFNISKSAKGGSIFEAWLNQPSVIDKTFDQLKPLNPSDLYEILSQNKVNSDRVIIEETR